MFFHAFNAYMEHGYPLDGVHPKSCKGSNSQGGAALTLIDALDTLVLLGANAEFADAVDRILKDIKNFAIDDRVHVFELTIRTLGGLLSAHTLILANPSLKPGYQGGLLALAEDLAQRLLPAFDTPTGIPLSWVNLKHGKIKGDVLATCTACASTLVLEFGLLSNLTGDSTYRRKAEHAIVSIYRLRNKGTDLVGNTLHTSSGRWQRTDAGIGAGADSYFEYLLKAYLLFGDEKYLRMFVKKYVAAMRYMKLAGTHRGFSWLMDVDMNSGRAIKAWISSLSAFWPGLQVTCGQLDEAVELHANYTTAYQAYGWLPEQFDMAVENHHPSEVAYPLRPEVIESTYLLHSATQDPWYLRVGQGILETLARNNRQKCGFSSVLNVSSGELEDTMESFFLSETTRYLYLLFKGSRAPLDYWVFTTEGHLFPVLEAPETAAPLEPHERCSDLCTPVSHAELADAAAEARHAFPGLPFDLASAERLRQRRCRLCSAVRRALDRHPLPTACQQRTVINVHIDQTCPAPPIAPGITVTLFRLPDPPPPPPPPAANMCPLRRDAAADARPPAADDDADDSDDCDAPRRHFICNLAINPFGAVVCGTLSLIPADVPIEQFQASVPESAVIVEVREPCAQPPRAAVLAFYTPPRAAAPPRSAAPRTSRAAPDATSSAHAAGDESVDGSRSADSAPLDTDLDGVRAAVGSATESSEQPADDRPCLEIERPAPSGAAPGRGAGPLTSDGSSESCAAATHAPAGSRSPERDALRKSREKADFIARLRRLVEHVPVAGGGALLLEASTAAFGPALADGSACLDAPLAAYSVLPDAALLRPTAAEPTSDGARPSDEQCRAHLDASPAQRESGDRRPPADAAAALALHRCLAHLKASRRAARRTDRTSPPHPARAAVAAPVSGPFVAAAPPEGCGPLANAAALRGAIAVLRRGGCSFASKVARAEAAGAVAAVIVNAEGDDSLVTMGEGGPFDAEPSIASALVRSGPGGMLLRLIDRVALEPPEPDEASSPAAECHAAEPSESAAEPCAERARPDASPPRDAASQELDAAPDGYAVADVGSGDDPCASDSPEAADEQPSRLSDGCRERQRSEPMADQPEDADPSAWRTPRRGGARHHGRGNLLDGAAHRRGAAAAADRPMITGVVVGGEVPKAMSIEEEPPTPVNIFITARTHTWLLVQIHGGLLPDFQALLSLATADLMSTVKVVLASEAELLAKSAPSQTPYAQSVDTISAEAQLELDASAASVEEDEYEDPSDDGDDAALSQIDDRMVGSLILDDRSSTLTL